MTGDPRFARESRGYMGGVAARCWVYRIVLYTFNRRRAHGGVDGGIGDGVDEGRKARTAERAAETDPESEKLRGLTPPYKYTLQKYILTGKL
eukprot:126958-Prymnesium_polylepis.1